MEDLQSCSPPAGTNLRRQHGIAALAGSARLVPGNHGDGGGVSDQALLEPRPHGLALARHCTDGDERRPGLR